ncbi:MAG TPA: cytochrome C [candidate division Zixibacteria bacterium]|nr:cytochrome C [candidate division Zixibacteria bacterium]
MNMLRLYGNVKNYQIILLAVCLSLMVVFASGCGKSDAGQQIERADIITIDAMTVFGRLSRPAVDYPHDMHTRALKERGKECADCHLKDDKGVMSQKFMRLTDENEKTTMQIYHDNCITCHKELRAGGFEVGPVVCGNCHSRKPEYVSSRQPMSYDYSLHYRHVKANNDSCGLCHHVYDEQKKELVYIKGQESSCRDCHQKEKIENVISMREASHQSCIGCHIEKQKGFQECSGCHDAKILGAIERVDTPGRIERNQPDFTLIGAAEKDIESSKMNSVPFDHKAHEGFTNSCRDCHHETLKACKECHTLAGDEVGDGITTQRAMHEMKSGHSCVGCHEKHKYDPQCGGCHSLMEQGRLSQHACEICHAGPEPEKLAKAKGKYKSIADFKPPRSKTKLTMAAKDIPEEVTIGIMADKYEPAKMPHRKIIDTLMNHIKNSRMATYFHGHEDVVCQGCHHHSPIGHKPPLCENCHGKPFDQSNLQIPGLYGAYHRQCLGCHEQMNIKLEKDCEGCHAAKQS